MRHYKVSVIFIVIITVAIAGFFLSASNRAARAYQSMLKQGDMDLQVIDTFIKTRDATGPDYYQALNLAAKLDERYLEQVVTLYARAEILLRNGNAERILGLLPSESIIVNTAAGRLLASPYDGHEDPQRAVRLLEYSARRGNRDAAEYLADLYRRHDCRIAAANWAQAANRRGKVSECAEIAVEASSFNDQEWQQITDNAQRIEAARRAGTIPQLEYSPDCVLKPALP